MFVQTEVTVIGKIKYVFHYHYRQRFGEGAKNFIERQVYQSLYTNLLLSYNFRSPTFFKSHFSKKLQNHDVQ